MPNLSKAAEAATPERKRKAHSEAKRSVATPSELAVTALRKAEAKRNLIKSQTLGLYSLKTKESPFGIPFAALTDALALAAAKQLLPLSDLYKVGTFCLYDGKCSALARPVLILDNKVS